MGAAERILIVDDEKKILQMFSLLLEDWGYCVTTASEADHALRLVAEEKFDIVFLDQFLGKTRGLDLMAKLAEIDHDIFFVIMTGNGSTDLAVEALKRGAADFITKPFFVADMVKSIDFVRKKRDLELQKKEMLQMLEKNLQEKTEELKNVYLPVLESLAQAMEKKDIGTYGHSVRVRHYSDVIAAGLEIGAEERENLRVAAMLHDIGKIGMSDFILGKPAPLSPPELSDVRKHPQKGVEILSPLKKVFSSLEIILPAILHHHEGYDGSGYPAGLSGRDIPPLSRIIAVADTYDAIMSHRPYRPGASHGQAISELALCSGSQFDPVVVKAFVESGKRYPELFPVRENALLRESVV
jgi:putative two-component system response regulator